MSHDLLVQVAYSKLSLCLTGLRTYLLKLDSTCGKHCRSDQRGRFRYKHDGFSIDDDDTKGNVT